MEETQKGENSSHVNKLPEKSIRGFEQRGKMPSPISYTSGEDAARLLRDLQNYQVELEAQNEQLMATRQELESAHSRYVNYYELAPVAYFNLNQKGFIIQCNRAAVSLLGFDCLFLQGKGLLSLVHKEDQSSFFAFFEELMAGTARRSCPVRMYTKAGNLLHLHLEGSRLEESGEREYLITATNFTEQKEAGEKLAASEELLHAAEDIALTGSYEVDVATMSLRFSDGLFRLFGEKPQSFVPTLDFVDARSLPEDVPVIRQILDQATQDKQPYYYIRRIYRSDGQLRTLESFGKVVCDKEGNAVKFVGLVQDITRRKVAEEALQKQETMYRSLVENTPDVITRWDKNLKLIFANSAFESKTGVENGSLLGKNNQEMGQPDDIALPWMQSLQKVFDTREAVVHYNSFPTPQGEVHFYSRIVPEKNAEGEVETVLAIARDITERKKAEEELLKQYHVLRQSEEVAGIGSWEYDIDTGNFHWSQGMYRLFGLPQGSPVTPDIYLDHVIAADCPVAQKIIYHLTGSHQPLEETLRIEAREKELTLKIKIIALHDEQGIPIKMLGVGVDISEFKRLEQENLQIRLRQQKQLMNAILDAQGEEQRRISESLHNGVGQILYATKLNLELVDLDMLPVHKEQINRALNVTRDLLTKAIKETRRVSHELVPILLKEFGLEIAIKDFVKHFSAGAIRLRYEVEGMSERLDSYLELALFRISQELVNNIVKHSGATEATLFLKKMESEVLLEVKDNGKGFEPGKTTTRGLGLRSMEDRVKLLNGTWQVDTHPGAGVKISIRIPVISYSV